MHLPRLNTSVRTHRGKASQAKVSLEALPEPWFSTATISCAVLASSHIHCWTFPIIRHQELERQDPKTGAVIPSQIKEVPNWFVYFSRYNLPSRADVVDNQMMSLRLSTIGNQAWSQLIQERPYNLFSETVPQLCTLCHCSPKQQQLEQSKKAALFLTDFSGEPSRHSKQGGWKSERSCDLLAARRTCPGNNNGTCLWGHD